VILGVVMIVGTLCHIGRCILLSLNYGSQRALFSAAQKTRNIVVQKFANVVPLNGLIERQNVVKSVELL